MAENLPAIKGRILPPGTYTLRQSCGEGSVGDTKIGLTTVTIPSRGVESDAHGKQATPYEASAFGNYPFEGENP